MEQDNQLQLDAPAGWTSVQFDPVFVDFHKRPELAPTNIILPSVWLTAQARQSKSAFPFGCVSTHEVPVFVDT
jgi:hypothetical protein